MPARSTSIYKFMPAGAVTTTNILFKVDMNAMINAGHFNPTTETVNIFNDFGLVNTTMVDDDNDGIYTLEVPSIGIGSIVSYKYRINDADDGREEISSRDYLVVEGANVVANQYERDLSTGVENVLKRGIVLYPMPVQTELNIQYSEQVSGKLHYNITDLTGNSIVSSSFWAEPGNGYYQIPCEELVPGFYLLNLSLNGIKQTFKIIIQ